MCLKEKKNSVFAFVFKIMQFPEYRYLSLYLVSFDQYFFLVKWKPYVECKIWSLSKVMDIKENGLYMWLNYTLVFCGVQARLREAASLERHVLLKKLRDALESLRGRVVGRNKDDVEEAIAMVSLV